MKKVFLCVSVLFLGLCGAREAEGAASRPLLSETRVPVWKATVQAIDRHIHTRAGDAWFERRMQIEQQLEPFGKELLEASVLSCTYGVPGAGVASQPYFFWDGNKPTVLTPAKLGSLPEYNTIHDIQESVGGGCPATEPVFGRAATAKRKPAQPVAETKFGFALELVFKGPQGSSFKTQLALAGEDLKMGVPAGVLGALEGDLIYRGKSRQLLLVNHSEKTYNVVDQEAIETRQAEMREQALANVAESIRDKVRERLKANDLAEHTGFELQRTGERATRNGLSCDGYEITKEGVRVEIWVTDWADIEGGAGYTETTP